MRIYFDSPNRPKTVAERLRADLQEKGHDRGLAACQEMTAHLYGYEDWHDLLWNIGSEPASQDDDEAGPHVAGERRTFHVSSLVTDGLEADLAQGLVASLHPTSNGGREKSQERPSSGRAWTEGEIAKEVADLAIRHGVATLHVILDKDDEVVRVVMRRGSQVRSVPAPFASGIGAGMRKAFGTPDGSYKASRTVLDDHAHSQSIRWQWLPGPDGQVAVPAYVQAKAALPEPVVEWPRSLEAIEDTSTKPARKPSPFPEIMEAFSRLGRPAWAPTRASNDVAPTASRYYGLPWLPDGVEWPRDAEGIPMRFVMQLAPADLTETARRLFGAGRLVSMFHSPAGGNDDPLGETRILRFDAGGEGALVRPPNGLEGKRPKARGIFFQHYVDYPRSDDTALAEDGLLSRVVFEDLEEMGDAGPGGTSFIRAFKAVDKDEVEGTMKALAELYGEPLPGKDVETFANMANRSGDKLGGWPCWEQDAEWPERDGRRLTCLYQLDHEDPFHKGADAIYGIGQIYIDPQDPDYLVYHWQCD